jgi:phage recombination protein Bet
MNERKQQQLIANDKKIVWDDQTVLKQIKEIFGRGLTQGEWNTLMQVGRSTKLNPFMREIWAVKYKDKPAHIFVGRDGYRKSAQAHPDYDCHQVDAVYSNDQFVQDKASDTVQHRYGLANRGELLGAYATVYRRNSSKPFYVSVPFDEYNLKQALWKDKPQTMIKKVAEAQALRMAFQELFAGTYCESEAFMNDQGETIPIVSDRITDVNRHFGLIDEPEPAPEIIMQNFQDVEEPVHVAPQVEKQTDKTAKTHLIEKCLNYLIGASENAA